MSKDRKPDAETPKKQPKAPQFTHAERLLDSLALIVDSGKAKTAADLLRYASQGGLTEGLPALRELADQGVPVDLALDALRVHVKIVAWKRGTGLIASCEGKKVALLLPLPPHVVSAFTHLSDLTYLLPDGHPLPPHLEDVAKNLVHGSREARRLAPTQDVLVFEVVKTPEGYASAPGAADVVDFRVLPPTTRLVAHVRSQKHPEDVPLDLGGRSLEVL